MQTKKCVNEKQTDENMRGRKNEQMKKSVNKKCTDGKIRERKNT